MFTPQYLSPKSGWLVYEWVTFSLKIGISVKSLNKFIWIDCNNKIAEVHFIKSKKIDDITHNFSYVSLLN